MKNNIYTSDRISFFSLLKWGFYKHFINPKINNENKIKIIKQDKLPKKNYAIWLGHATVWMNINNLNIIVDPVLSNIPFYKRATELPVDKDKLMPDIILITHAHYDHFDMSSVKFFIQKNPNVKIIAPKGFKRYLDKETHLIELDWWENIKIKDITITFVPSLHWSNRLGIDKNKVLWGGFVISNKTYSIYHAGDSGYGEHFAKIGKKFNIDNAFLPIGAYKPEYIMKHDHINPQEALKACTDLKAKRLIPVHYGTFRLSDEALHEPLEWLENLLQQQTYPFETMVVDIGEIIYLSNISTLKST
jgi:L-ascorbate metabolism protein UlaG (beta-lactamase superfamily)